MSEKISLLIEELKKELTGLPEAEIQEAVAFYEEYLSDALEAGKDLDQVMEVLGTPKKIADTIRAETSLVKARKEPGLKNFNSAYSNAFKAVTAPLSVFWLAITALISYSMVAMLFGGAFAAALGGAAVVLVMIYEAVKIPLHFFPSILGAVGSGLLGGGICLVTAIYLYRLGRLFIRFSTSLIRVILKLSGKPAVEKRESAKPKRKSTIPALLIAMAVGLLLTLISGLPQTYLTIFNSMRPAQEKSVSYEYSASDIDRIVVNTAHSAIRVERDNVNKIIISYNQPAWLEHEVSTKGGILEFIEKSSGMLPLFELVQLHENMSGITVLIPEKFEPGSIKLKSTGGHITVGGLYKDLSAETLNGNISCDTQKQFGKISFNAGTLKGTLTVDGNAIKVDKGGPAYVEKGSEDRRYDLHTVNGDVNIN